MNSDLEGYQTLWVKNLQGAYDQHSDFKPDIIILDLNLPDGHGFDFITYLREKKDLTPIIVLTAQTDEDSVVKGLDLGANDYVFKPSSFKILFARMKSQLKLTQTNEDLLSHGELKIDTEKRTVKNSSNEISFSRAEYDIFLALFKRQGCIFSRENIMDIANLGEDSTDRTVDAHISNIRKKLKKNNVSSLAIKTEYGIGYRLNFS